MDSKSCNICCETFTRNYNLKRHIMRKHNITKMENTMKTETSEKAFVLRHPFTMLLCGPTACGKSTLMKTILENNRSKISPSPQRIVWLFRRWQPLYDIIKSTVKPEVEFIQGIPNGIDNPKFFNPHINNLLIVDDLMASCGDDPRMTEIFYEGSHHRSLSVVLLCQNLYYSKSPTQRRNCHYIVLFKNPNDLQSVMTLARQINPQKTKEFMRNYEAATLKPHTYLLLDFKQATDESERFQPNALDVNHSKEFDQSDDTHKVGIPVQNDDKGMDKDDYIHSTDRRPGGNIYNSEDFNMISCDDCGIVLDSVHDLQQHVKFWCAMKHQQPNGLNLMQGTKRALIEDNSDNTMPMQTSHTSNFMSNRYKRRATSLPSPDKTEYQCFAPIRIEVGRFWKKNLKEGQEKHINEGYNEKQAKSMAIDDNIKDIRKDLREAYANYITHWMDLSENSKIHQKVMTKVEELHDTEDFDWGSAARMAIKEYKPIINANILPEVKNDKDDDNLEEDDSEDSESEEEEDKI